MGSAIGAQSVLNPTGKKWKRSLFADLLLTALIDAFSILVIFLLMNFSSTGEILFINKGVELPKASQADMLERNTVVRYDEGKFFIENKEMVNQDAMIQELLDTRKEWSSTHPNEEFKGILTIQADKKTKYENLNSIVLAMAHAGYGEIRFAVVTK
ncbi:MAG: biopolymer transporter ExbD [Moraxellaceae bacterium]|nr:biopolymer transporter ExbD [Pseudobdellovibrionaceae bacterium]